MKKKKALLNVVFALGVLALLATSVSTCVLYSKVRELEAAATSEPVPVEAEPTEEVAEAAAVDSMGPVPAATNAVAVAQKKEEKPAPEPVREMKVIDVAYDGHRELTLYLSEEPDLAVAAEYLSIEPAPADRFTTSVCWNWNWRTKRREPCLEVIGDFLYRTNTVLRLRKGFPMRDQASLAADEARALAKDFVHTFKRNDASPKVAFADKGRYLPPIGRRTIALTAVNMPKIKATVRRLPPVNIVPMLALEEDAYTKIRTNWGVGDGFAEDLSAEVASFDLTAENVPNREERLALNLDGTGAASNGVYVVRVVDAKEENESVLRWRDDSDSSWHRVVCVSDLGLSVRQMKSGLLVWVSSLTKGTPVEGATIDVFSTANVRLATGVSNAQGWTLCKLSGKGEPFAVVVTAADGSDRSFIALTDRMAIDERPVDAREAYLAPDETTAFAWTERGIYRHDERIFFQAILRDGTGRAPKPFPLKLRLYTPSGHLYAEHSAMPDANGAVSDESFTVSADLPSGTWRLVLCTPGKNGKTLGERKVKIEEFALPQIRVKALAAKDVRPQDFAFTVSAEHLYGGPAKALLCEGAVIFEDVPFTPSAWKGWHFGNADRGLKPSYREFGKERLDDQGRHTYTAPIWADTGKPKAAVRVTAQGTVFEDGGRPATARDSVVAHFYPYYIGTTLDGWVRKPAIGAPVISVACVNPDGTRVAAVKKLTVRLERIDSIFSYKKNENGWMTWDCEYVRVPVSEKVPLETAADGSAEFKLPTEVCGDYALTIEDVESDVSFARTFYLSDWGDSSVRAPLSNPTAVSLKADKPFYRPGEKPRLVVKSPFVGTALLSVMRDDLIYAKSLTLTNATSEIELAPCEASWAPNVEVRLSVVQSVKPGAKGFTARAQGGTTIVVRRPENEVPVAVKTAVAPLTGGDDAGFGVTASVSAPGATHAVVTLVDEGINILTGEPLPDPLGFFAKPRLCLDAMGFFDLYHRLLPVFGEDDLRRSGVKTGGGGNAGMLGRVSPVPTRRFKPLALWRKDVPVVDGKASVTFSLPEFVGEVRVTAVAYSDVATGSACTQQKVCPKLVMEPDAPRFVAPRDTFRVSLPLANRSEAAGPIDYRVTDGSGKEIGKGRISLRPGDSLVVKMEATAPAAPGQLALTYTAEGFGERHVKTLEVPVRPAVAWQETSGVEALAPGQSWTLPRPAADVPFTFTKSVSGARIAELKGALEWLAEYPHGCLEQTTSRIFPLLAADKVLSATGSAKGANRAEIVRAGVKRVESMVRQTNFVMWPDCDYAPWDPEVSLYAAHFLIEAERNGVPLNAYARQRVMAFLDKWGRSPTNAIAAYACQTLALAGKSYKDRMLRLYDERASLDLLSRARLARAFVATADRPRAQQLLANAESPASVREAAFLMLALLELDANDARLPRLVTYLMDNRQKARSSWGTTGENAHALLALAAYYKAHPASEGKPDVREMDGALVNAGTAPAFVTWRALSLPEPGAVAEERTQLGLTRSYLKPDGTPYDLAKASCGDLVIVRLTLTSDVTRDYNDLVIEDLFPGAFEPMHTPLSEALYPWFSRADHAWVMRRDARDDRMLVFSKKFRLEKDDEVHFSYPVRVVSSGAFALPGVAVDAMYQPSLRVRTRAGRLVVRD